LRFSLGKQNTEDEIDFAIALVPETVARLRELSPAWSATAVGR
jgi:cysteine desulfurase